MCGAVVLRVPASHEPHRQHTTSEKHDCEQKESSIHDALRFEEWGSTVFEFTHRPGNVYADAPLA